MKVLKIANIVLLIIIILSGCKQKNPADISGILQQSNDSTQIYGTGYVEYADNSFYVISPAIGGFLKKTLVENNDQIKAGQAIAVLEHPDYLDIQIEYLSKKRELEFLREDYKRQGELTVENVTSIKKMQQAQADYLSKEAYCTGLEKKLLLLGINPDKIIKDGPKSSIVLYARKGGKINFEGLTEGMFLSSDKPAYKIIKYDSLIIKSVFDINFLGIINRTDSINYDFNGNFVCKGLINKQSIKIINEKVVFNSTILKKPEYFIQGIILKSIIKK